MNSMRKQIAVLSVFMVLVVVALTLGGLQLFGKGKVKPSEWFKKEETKIEQTVPETAASFTRSALLAASEDTIAPQSDLPVGGMVSLKSDGVQIGSLAFIGTQTSEVRGNASVSVTVYTFDVSADVSSYIEQGYTNFRLVSPSAISNAANGSVYSFYFENNKYGFRSGASCAISVSQIMGYINNDSGYVACDLVRTEVPLPADPVKEGHTFAGWYYGTQAEHGDSCTAYDGAPIYEDTNLHAHWTINTYTVTFDTAGGSEIESIIVDWNTAATLSTPIRVGYNFVGWYLADGTKYTNQAIKTNTTLTAHWEIKTFKVAFYVDGEKHNEITVEYGTKLVDAMEAANIASYAAMTTEGVRLSKMNTTITEDTQVLVQELTRMEKIGDYIGTHDWVLWTTVALLGALVITAGVSIAVAVKRG